MVTAKDAMEYREENGVGLNEAKRILEARAFKERFDREIADLRMRSYDRDNCDLDVIADMFEIIVKHFGVDQK